LPPLPLLLYVLPTTLCVSLVACAIIFMLVGTHKIMETSRHSCPGSFHAQTSRHSIFSPKLWGIVPIPATLLDLYVVMAGSRTLCTWVVTHVLFAWAMHAHLHFSWPNSHLSPACPNFCIHAPTGPIPVALEISRGDKARMRVYIFTNEL
jgi:hypothetical protein